MEINFKNLAIGTLSQEKYCVTHYSFIKRFGPNGACVVAEAFNIYNMAVRYESFFNNGELGEWFYITKEYIEQKLGLKRTAYDTAIKSLIKEGVLIQKRMGIPSKNYYQFNWEKIVDILQEPLPDIDCGISAVKDVGRKSSQKSTNISSKSTRKTEPKLVQIENEENAEKAREIQTAENQQSMVNDFSNQRSTNSAFILTNNKYKDNNTNTNNINISKPLSLSEEIYQLQIPLNLRKKLEGLRDKIQELNFNIFDLERFYNTFDWVKENCSKDEHDYLNQWDIENMLHHIFEKEIKIEKSTFGLLKEIAYTRLHYKHEEVFGESHYSPEGTPTTYNWLDEPDKENA